MADRLFVGALGNRNSGKSHTWNTLFGRTVKTGKETRLLNLLPGKCVEVFLISGSFEERGEYAGDILSNQNCRIVLCSIQHTKEAHKTLDYTIGQGFQHYVQWLNPGYSDPDKTADDLDVAERVLSAHSVFSIRDGKGDAEIRVQEIREFIYGWSKYRNLLIPC